MKDLYLQILLFVAIGFFLFSPPTYLLAKRILDFSMSFLVLILSLVFVVPIILLLRITGEGEVFYFQERIGLNNQPFYIWKFATMLKDSPNMGTGTITVKNDPRVTTIGKYLRKSKVNELPQIINVLKGDMSLVGPRPERPVFVKDFKKSVPKYMLRLKMKAGLTGWAQVNGWRGNTSLDKRIEFDLYYIKNWSLLLDLKIILMTFWKGFVNPNAY